MEEDTSNAKLQDTENELEQDDIMLFGEATSEMESDAELCNVVDVTNELGVHTPHPSAAQQHITINHPAFTDLRIAIIAPSMVQP